MLTANNERKGVLTMCCRITVRRQQFNGMFAGAAVASVLYDRYPGEAERKRRTQEGKEAGNTLEKLFKKPTN